MVIISTSLVSIKYILSISSFIFWESMSIMDNTYQLYALNYIIVSNHSLIVQRESSQTSCYCEYVIHYTITALFGSNLYSVEASQSIANVSEYARILLVKLSQLHILMYLINSIYKYIWNYLSSYQLITLKRINSLVLLKSTI